LLLIIVVVNSTVSVTAAPRAALAGIRDGEDEELHVNKRDEEDYDDDDEEISVVDVDDHKSKRDEPRTLSTFLTYRLSLVGLGLR